jgi:pilus assembly protein Flp/PilA
VSPFPPPGFPKRQTALISAKEWRLMKDRFTKVKQFIRAEEGASAVEYGLLVAGIAVAVMVAIYTIGTNLNTKFTNVANKLNE